MVLSDVRQQFRLPCVDRDCIQQVGHTADPQLIVNEAGLGIPKNHKTPEGEIDIARHDIVIVLRNGIELCVLVVLLSVVSAARGW